MADNDTDDGRTDAELADLRAEIAEIDRDLVELIARRTYVAESIARVKRERDLPTTDETQEQRVMERAARYAERFDVDVETVEEVFELLIELNKIEQNQHALNDGQQSNWDSDEG